jgi:hypothetical protein
LDSGSLLLANNLGNRRSATEVRLLANRLVLDNDSEIQAGTRSAGNAGRLRVQANLIEVLDGSRIASDTDGSGKAGIVLVDADSITLENMGAIGSATGSSGDAGEVRVTAGDVRILGFEGAPELTGITASSQPNSTGRAGNLHIDATGEVLISGGQAFISSTTRNAHNGGIVDVTAGRHSHVRPSPVVGERRPDRGLGGRDHRRSRPHQLTATGPSFFSDGSALLTLGGAGSVAVEANRIELTNGAEIGSSGFGLGDAGTVDVTARERVTMAGGSGMFSSAWNLHVFLDYLRFGISPAENAAGSVRVTTPVLVLTDRSEIGTQSFTGGSAGNVVINASESLLLDNADIETEALLAGGGGITLQVGDFVLLTDGSRMASSIFGDEPGDRAGNIDIGSQFLILDESSITAQARAGDDGNIQIGVEQLIGSLDVINATSERGIDGTVAVSSPEVDLTGGLVMLDPTLLDAASQLRERCTARRDIGASSFTGISRGGLPPGPDQPLMSDYRTGAPTRADAAGSGGAEADFAGIGVPIERGSIERAPAACRGAPRSGRSLVLDDAGERRLQIRHRQGTRDVWRNTG